MQDALVDGSLACHFFFSSVSSDVLEAPASAKGYTPKVNSLKGGFHCTSRICNPQQKSFHFTVYETFGSVQMTHVGFENLVSSENLTI